MTLSVSNRGSWLALLAVSWLCACDQGAEIADDAGNRPPPRRDAGAPSRADAALPLESDAATAAEDAGTRPPDAGSFGSTFDCSRSTTRYCQDFDDVAPFSLEADRRGTSVVPPGTGFRRTYVGGHDDSENIGYMSLEQVRTHSGGGALRTRVDWIRNGGTSHTAWSRGVLEMRDSDLYVRGYVYLPASSVGSDTTLFMFTEITGSYYGAMGVSLRTDGKLGTFGYGGTYSSGWTDDAPFPTDRWVCVELRRTQTPVGSPTFSTWIDGRALQDVPLTLGSRTLDELSIGQYGFDNDQINVEILFDDIVVATERIGCE